MWPLSLIYAIAWIDGTPICYSKSSAPLFTARYFFERLVVR